MPHKIPLLILLNFGEATAKYNELLCSIQVLLSKENWKQKKTYLDRQNRFIMFTNNIYKIIHPF